LRYGLACQPMWVSAIAIRLLSVGQVFQWYRSKVSLGESSTRSAFQILLKRLRFRGVSKTDCGFDKPRTKFHSVKNLTFVVFLKTGGGIFRAASVVPFRMSFAFQDVNVGCSHLKRLMKLLIREKA